MDVYTSSLREQQLSHSVLMETGVMGIEVARNSDDRLSRRVRVKSVFG